MAGKQAAWAMGQSHSWFRWHRARGNGLRGGLTCVPLMVAAAPGKVDGEAAEEVEEGPGQDNDVVGIEEDKDHLGGIADAWRERGRAGLGTVDRFLTLCPLVLRWVGASPSGS